MQTRLNLASCSVMYNMGGHQTVSKPCESPASSFKIKRYVYYMHKNVSVNRD